MHYAPVLSFWVSVQEAEKCEGEDSGSLKRFFRFIIILSRRNYKMDKKKYYITTAIAYTSGKPHIGNTYEIVLADAIARYKRQEG